MDQNREKYYFENGETSNAAPQDPYYPRLIPPYPSNSFTPFNPSGNVRGAPPSGSKNELWNSGHHFRNGTSGLERTSGVTNSTASIDTMTLGLDQLRNNLPPLNTPTGSRFCTACSNQKTPAHAFCYTCNESLCGECVTAHKRVKLTREHPLEPLTPVGRQSTPELETVEPTFPFANQTYFCPHHAEESNFWCRRCQVKCCHNCLRETDFHLGHDTVAITQSNAKPDGNFISIMNPHILNSQPKRPSQQELSMLRNHATVICNHMESCIDQLRTYNRMIEDNHLNATSELKRYFDEIMSKYKYEKDQLEIKLESIKDERIQSLNERHNSLYEKHKKIKHYLQNTANLNPTALQAFKSLISENKNFPITGIPPISFNDVKISFKPIIYPIQIGRIITSASATNTTASGPGLERAFVNFTANFKVYPKDIDDQIVEIQNESEIEIIFTPPNVKFKKEKQVDNSIVIQWIPGEVTDFKIQICYKRIQIKDSPWIVNVTEKRDYRRLNQPELYGQPKIIGKQGNKDGEFNRPWGVCATTDGGFCVADRSNNRLQFFNGNGDHLTTYPKLAEGEEIKNSDEDGKFNRPAGVTFTHTPFTAIIVADKDNHRIQIMRYEVIKNEIILKFVRRFGEQGQLPGQFNYPWDVSCNQRGDIVVSDSRNRRVQLFDFEGTYIRNYGFKQSVSSKHFDYPRGVCFDRNGKICVTDFNIHRLFIINEKMTEAFYIGSEGASPSRFNRPQGVAVDQDGRIIVVDTKNRRLQVFDADGAFLIEYGKLNAAKGPTFQFVRPSGICITTEGKIIVVEEDEGHRIQII